MDYHVYEPKYYEFDLVGLEGFDSSNIIDLKKYHYLFCAFINSNSKKELIKHRFSKESTIALKTNLEWAIDYPIFEVFEEQADFSVKREDYNWQWMRTNDYLAISKDFPNNKNIEFRIENIDEDGSSIDFDEVDIIIETLSGERLKGDAVTVMHFIDNTKVIGFNTALSERYYFSKENAETQKESIIIELEQLIPLIDHNNYKITALSELLTFIESLE